MLPVALSNGAAQHFNPINPPSFSPAQSHPGNVNSSAAAAVIGSGGGAPPLVASEHIVYILDGCLEGEPSIRGNRRDPPGRESVYL